jgi:hypothetical protein
VRGKIIIANKDNSTFFVPTEENEVKNTLSYVKSKPWCRSACPAVLVEAYQGILKLSWYIVFVMFNGARNNFDY